MPKPIPKIGFISLGCPKALVDSERILTRLRAEGYELVASYAEADLVVVNTCGFIHSAIIESLEAIGEALTKNGKVIVTGCLGTQASLVNETYRQVLAVTGPHAYEQVMKAVHQHLPPPHGPFTSLVPPSGIKLTPPHNEDFLQDHAIRCAAADGAGSPTHNRHRRCSPPAYSQSRPSSRCTSTAVRLPAKSTCSRNKIGLQQI
jgi:tRNA A37 methylthiotransferase MiaB